MSSGSKPAFDNASVWKSVLVSTIAGDGKDHSADGIGLAAGISNAYGLTAFAGGKSLAFVETGSHRVRRFALTGGTGTGTSQRNRAWYSHRELIIAWSDMICGMWL